MRTTALFLAVFTVSVLEVFWLREAMHASLGPNLTVMGFYSRDIYFPLFLGLVACFVFLYRQKKFLLHFRPPAFFLNLVLLLFVGGLLNNVFRFQAAVGSGAFVAVLLFTSFLLVGSSFFLFVSSQDLLSRVRPLGGRLIYLVGALALLFLYPLILSLFWHPLVRMTGQSVYLALRVLGLNVTRFSVDYWIGIHHPDLRVAIGMGCSGLEGIFFFLFAYSLYLLFLEKPDPFSRVALTAATGSIYMFLLNTVRIVLFFTVAVAINQSGLKTGADFFRWAFHENIGWLLYLLGLIFFFSLLRYRREFPSHRS